jgi:hypothetical protein
MLQKTLKNTDIADIDDVIRGYDFKPMAGREDSFVEGRVITKGYNPEIGYSAYSIKVTRDVFGGELQPEGAKGSRVGKLVYIPFEVSFMEYPGRIINLSK